jgi:hypothetical protein
MVAKALGLDGARRVSKLATWKCGKTTATLEVTDSGEVVLHYEPLETELALEALGDAGAISDCTRLWLLMENTPQPVTLELIFADPQIREFDWIIELYEALIELGVDVNAPGYEYEHCDDIIPTFILVGPVISGNAYLVEMFLKAGADPNMDDGYLLEEADEEIGLLLFEYGFDPDQEHAARGLSASAAFNELKIVKAALEAGTSNVLEMLSPAAQLGHLAIVKAILAYPYTNKAHVEQAWRDATSFGRRVSKLPAGNMDGGRLEGDYWDSWVWGEGPDAALPLLDAWLEDHPHDEDE